MLVENRDLEMAIRNINTQLEKSKDYTAKSTIDQKMQLKREQEAHRKTVGGIYRCRSQDNSSSPRVLPGPYPARTPEPKPLHPPPCLCPCPALPRHYTRRKCC